MPFLVETVAAFNTAIKTATGGETILLKGGVNFGQLKLYRPASPYLSEVTVRSEDPSNRATLHSVAIDRANNLTIRDVNFVNEDRFATITMGACHNITIDNCDVTANHDPYEAPASFITGISVRGYCTNVTISNNLLYRLGSVLSIGQTDGIQVIGNTFRENQLDSINCSSDVCNIVIRGNTFYAQLAKNKPGHHYDNIQFWVHPQATQNSKNILIEDNNIFDFHGIGAQSIFMRANYNDANGDLIPFMFENVVIRNNLIIAQQANAIAVTRSAGLRIHNNTLVYGGDRHSNPSGVNIPGIGQSMSTDAHVYNNILPIKHGQPAVDTDEFYGNIRYNLIDGSLARFLLNPYAPEKVRENFTTMPIREAIGKGISSVASGGPVALFDYYLRSTDGEYLYAFDGSLTTPDADHKYVWTFDDGTVLEGRTVARTFEKGGIQNVTLTVTDVQGRSNSFTKQQITVLDPGILDYNFDDGLVDDTAFPSDLRQTKELVTVPDATGGSAVVIGGNNGHLYLPPTDPDLQQIEQTRQLTVAMDFKAIKAENTATMTLAAKHGVWNIGILPSSGVVQFALSGKFYRFNPGVDLLNDTWYRLAMAFNATGMRFYVDTVLAGEVTPPPEDMARIFDPGTYGLGIGGTGPWHNTATTTKFTIDNLHVTATA
jgi:PKD repeat protein